jgi:hypothetical protein
VKLREWLARADAIQKSTPFKVVASIVIVGLAIAFFASYMVARHAPGSEIAGAIAELERAAAEAPQDQQGSDRTVVDTGLRAAQRVLQGGSVVQGVAIGTVAVSVLALAIVWLGLGLTYIAMGAFAAGVAFGLGRLGGFEGVARLGLGVTILAACFTVLMRLAGLALSGPGPTLAVARNVLAEAVRIKVSLVFVILLMLLMAILPLMLNPEQPLRYRVQSFLQYATGGSFWVIAMLTLFFSASTVTLEQRDRVIWQTVTKPVAAWQYILGKWMGVVTLATVLMAVCATTTFLFTEYLRSQPAMGEERAYVAQGGGVISDDRLVLETQILAARKAILFNPPFEKYEPDFVQAVEKYIKDQQVREPTFGESPARRQEVIDDLYKTATDAYRAIEPGRAERYMFTGLESAKRSGSPLTFRYRVDMGSNRPDQTAKVTFVFNRSGQIVQETGLGNWHTISLTPAAIADDGTVEVIVYNADLNTGFVNPLTISFPRDGMEISYSKGSYRGNFVRVMLVLLVKLAFLSMLTICVSTFVSFPVACLVSIGVFLMAEGAGFLKEALENYSTVSKDGDVLILQTIATWIATGVQWVFNIYGELKPTGRLVDGRLLSFGTMAGGIMVLLVWTTALYGAAVAIFRKRELATYSGQ